MRRLIWIAPILALSAAPAQASDHPNNYKNIDRCVQKTRAMRYRAPIKITKGLKIFGSKFNCHASNIAVKEKPEARYNDPNRHVSWRIQFSHHKRFRSDDQIYATVIVRHYNRLRYKNSPMCEFNFTFDPGKRGKGLKLSRHQQSLIGTRNAERSLRRARAIYRRDGSKNWNWGETLKWVFVLTADKMVPKGCTRK